jgi:hypothetical protein
LLVELAQVVDMAAAVVLVDTEQQQDLPLPNQPITPAQ